MFSSKWLLLLAAMLFFSGSCAIAQIVAAEYFIDSDPGAGHGTPLAIYAGDSVDLLATVSSENLAPGRHTCSIRFQQTGGAWTFANGKSFLISAAGAVSEDIVGAEYFLDTDPGVGQATPVGISPGDSLDVIFAASASSLTPGPHTAAIRYRTASGNWTSTSRKSLLLQSNAWPEGTRIVSATCSLQGLLLDGIAFDSTFNFLPADGLLDSPSEAVYALLNTGYNSTPGTLQRGTYTATATYHDDLGQIYSWIANFEVSSGLVIFPAYPDANSVFLHWYQGPQDRGAYSVYRGSNINGTYAFVDSTSQGYYTDTILPDPQGRRFYRITARYLGYAVLIEGDRITPLDPAYRDR